MSEPRRLRCYDYVERPYEAVRALLHERALAVLQGATTSASARANALAGSLRVAVSGVEIGVDVRLQVKSVHDGTGIGGLSPVTHVALEWQAAKAPGLFPLMTAQLSAWPLSATETQLEIEGEYVPPLGALGTALDAAVGHRIADASVHRFLADAIEQIRREVPGSASSASSASSAKK